jgi:serine/threonine protein kinase
MKKIPMTKNYFDFEAKLLLTLNHPNVIQVNEVFHEKEHLVLILELAEEGDLHQFIKRNHFKRVPETQVVSWFCQLCLGLYYLHH